MKVELGKRTRGIIAGLGVAVLMAGMLLGVGASVLSELEVKGKMLAGWTFLAVGFGFLLGVIAQHYVCAQ